jgi:hypothetical protein
MARDIVRALQEGRKNAGLEISDRIHITWTSESTDVADTMQAHGTEIAAEVLAVTVRRVTHNVTSFTVTGSESDIDADFGIDKA